MRELQEGHSWRLWPEQGVEDREVYQEGQQVSKVTMC